MEELTENEALGAAIRARREKAGLTQAELGRRAGYKSGAAVSISRVEAGSNRPSVDRLAGIAATLGCTVRRLESEGATRYAKSNIEPVNASNNAESTPRSAKAWLNLISERIQARQQVLGQALEVFDAGHERARDDFFLPFLATAGRISAAPIHPEPEPPEDEPTAQQQAEQKLRSVNSGLAIALTTAVAAGFAGAASGAAYVSFVAASAFGTASTGAALTGVGLTGVGGGAGLNAALAALGGGSLTIAGTGAAAVLAGVVAAPMAVVAAGGVLWLVRRNRRQDAQLREQLQQAQEKLDRTEAGFKKLLATLHESADILDYIAIHAGHALSRWSLTFTLPIDWEALPEGARQGYRDFTTLAACQVTLVTVDMLNYLTLTDEPLEAFMAVTDEVLLQARKEIQALV